MDEIGEITDYIQDEAGSTADVIWGHGYDPTLGNKLSVTLVATGFHSSPFTGFEKAPEKTVSVLEDEPKNEIKTPLSSPTHQVVTEKKEEEPFLKSEPKAEEVKTTTSGTIEFDWEVKSEAKPMTSPTSSSPQFVEEKEEPKRYFLEDETQAKVELENTVQKAPVSAEELQRRNMERMERIKNYNSKLKKAEGLKELEDEPAFVRRNIHLDQVVKSEESNVSRFGLSDDGIKTNNSFLHDNVD
ncbi:cell division protein FtsZ [compost metagenome]